MDAEDNYMRKIREMAARGDLAIDYGFADVDISHDDWCGIFAGRRCDCDPDIAVRKRV